MGLNSIFLPSNGPKFVGLSLKASMQKEITEHLIDQKPDRSNKSSFISTSSAELVCTRSKAWNYEHKKASNYFLCTLNSSLLHF